jgi:hypothetical protein
MMPRKLTVRHCVQAMASTLLEGKCQPNGDDKAKYCKEVACKEYTTYDPEWTPCLEECTKQSSAKLTAAVKAVATIDIRVEEYCNGHDYMRTGETYLTQLYGYADSTQVDTTPEDTTQAS